MEVTITFKCTDPSKTECEIKDWVWRQIIKDLYFISSDLEKFNKAHFNENYEIIIGKIGNE